MNNIDKTGQIYNQVFQDWEVKEFINAGGAGGVFRIVRKEQFIVGDLEESAALKVVPIIEQSGRFNMMTPVAKKQYVENRENQRAVAANELKLMYKLHGHPHIVKYEDYRFLNWERGNAFGTWLMIRMDFLETLSDLQKTEDFPESKIIEIGKAMCKALMYCHSNDIIHRDIKPQNIFRNSAGIYMLGDFGIAKMIDMANGTKSMVGTRLYAAPEQLKDQKYDLRVDIYSLGLVLYEMCNQMKLPFVNECEGDLFESLLRRHRPGCIFPRTKIASTTLEAVIRKACAFDPKERFQSAEEFLEALNKIPSNQEKVYEEADAAESLNDIIHYANDLNVPNSQYRLAYYYRENKDFKKARFWLYRAAKNGHLKAMVNMGLCYIKGDIGLIQNGQIGMRWLLYAADCGSTSALYYLGRCYEEGIGTEKDMAMAIQCYQLAAQKGNKDAIMKLRN